MCSDEEYLERVLGFFDISVSPEQADKFLLFYKMLTEKNKVMNLTGITAFKDVAVKHFADSLSAVRIIDLRTASRMIDVGSGAGFPGIPIQILFPEIEMVLLDATEKRVRFMNEVCAKLNLKNIRAEHGRAENFARKPGYRDAFDLCVSRAVATLPALAEYCMPFVKVNGSFLCYKSGNADEEINGSFAAVSELNGKIEKQIYFNLPDSGDKRCLIQIKKTGQTPDKYPRKAGMPVKKPL